jgi:hypothetical protein
VGSAAQVQPEVNAIRHGGKQSATRKALRNAEDPKQEDQQNAEDENQLPK